MKMMLTEKQIRVLRYFRDYRRQHGIAPTLEEAATALGVSKITIYEHLNHLVQKGAVYRDKAKARAVAILYDPDLDEWTEKRPSRRVARPPSLPILGTIAAGRPIEALEDREDVRLDELIPCGDDHYLLRVRGQSMIEDHIEDGDFVVIRKQEVANNGERVVAMIDNEVTLKRFYRDGETIRLEPANGTMAPIYVDPDSDAKILGILVGVVRKR